VAQDQGKRTIILAEQAIALAIFIAGVVSVWDSKDLSQFQKSWIAYLMFVCGGLGTLSSMIYNPHLWGETIEKAFLKEISIYILYGKNFIKKNEGKNIVVINSEFQYWISQATRFVSRTQDNYFPVQFPGEGVSNAVDGFKNNVDLLENFERGVRGKWILLNPNISVQEIHHYGFTDVLKVNWKTKRAAKQLNRLLNPKLKMLPEVRPFTVLSGLWLKLPMPIKLYILKWKASKRL
jgi:hypothetical protein